MRGGSGNPASSQTAGTAVQVRVYLPRSGFVQCAVAADIDRRPCLPKLSISLFHGRLAGWSGIR